MTPDPPSPPVGTPGEAVPRALPLWRRQFPILLIVPSAFLVAIAASPLLRGFLFPVFWDPPFFLNPLIVFLYVFYVGLGLLLLTGRSDRGWPFFLGCVGFLVLVFAFVDMSMILWFDLQLGARLTPPGVNPIMILALAVAVSASILLHVNVIARGLCVSLRARGLDAAEIHILEEESRREGQRHVSLLLGFTAIAGLVLWIGHFALGGATLGLNVLGIMTGLLAVSLFLVVVYRLLSRGPLDLDAATAGVVSAYEVEQVSLSGPGREGAADASGKNGDGTDLEWRRV